MIYPPRAENRVGENMISEFLPLDWVAQPKMNGTAIIVIVIDGHVTVMNRNAKVYRTKITDAEYRAICPRLKSFTICGEYLNKASNDESGTPLRDKFVIWDFLSVNGDDLIGLTIKERTKILFEHVIYCKKSKRPYISQEISDSIYVVRTFQRNFQKAYKLSRIDVIEGLVLKRRGAKLKPFFREDNNSDWQVKIRKATKCYAF